MTKKYGGRCPDCDNLPDECNCEIKSEDFMRWACDLSDIAFDGIYPKEKGNDNFSLVILLKAMWEINDKKNFIIYPLYPDNCYCVINQKTYKTEFFYFKKGSESKQKALTAALKYIFDQKKNDL